MSRSNTLARVRDLRKTFVHRGRTLTVLQGLDLEVMRGEMIAVVGTSGAGKSTFLHIMGTLDYPSQGTVELMGEDVFAMEPEALAKFRNRRIGFIFQFHHLLPEFTTLENVLMPALIARVSPKEAKQKATDILREVNLSHRLHHRPGELSGGEQQRVALARALIMDPALVLADEPTGNLDEKTSEEVHELMFRLNRERETTFIVVTHNQELARRMDRTFKLREGVLTDVSHSVHAVGSTPTGDGGDT